MTPRVDYGDAPLAPPPWLWLLLGNYGWQLPSGVSWWHAQIRDLWTDDGNYSAEIVASPGFAALRVTTVSQVMPSLVLVAGLVTVVIPYVRGWYTSWRYRLTDLTALDGRSVGGTEHGLPALRHFVETHAPGTGIKVAMWAKSPPARVYAAGCRKRRIAVSLGFVALWRRNPERARVLLIHEVGHLDSGEHLIAGLGSPFTRAIQAWPLVFLASGLAPLVWLGVRHEPTASLMWSQVVVVLSKATVVLVPVLALWCSELAADRCAVAASGRRAVVDALEELRSGRRRWGWFTEVTHPPMRLRRWCVERADRPVVPMLLTAAGPVALLAYALLTTCLAAVALVLLGDPPSAAIASSVELAHRDLLTVPLWSGMVAVVLVWPALAGLWLRLWRGPGGIARVPVAGPGASAAPRVFGMHPWTVRATAVVLPALVLVFALLPLSGAVDRDPVLRPSATADESSSP
ncbi:hypothetical protein ACIRU3_40210 [Streptomyces sp. NPDC101151]|uniref:hypothetical protein n=1 Tax=Streptomyces sp. NPDC101151 TaxID=3366115 RepID=UPI0037F33F91